MKPPCVQTYMFLRYDGLKILSAAIRQASNDFGDNAPTIRSPYPRPPVTKAEINGLSFIDVVAPPTFTGRVCQADRAGPISSHGLDITHLRDFVALKDQDRPDLYDIEGSRDWLPCTERLSN